MNETAIQWLGLLELAASRLGCEYLSDLRYIDGLQRARLSRQLEKVPDSAVSLREWNDALEYLTGQPPEPTPEAAKARLLQTLRSPAQAT